MENNGERGKRGMQQLGFSHPASITTTIYTITAARTAVAIVDRSRIVGGGRWGYRGSEGKDEKNGVGEGGRSSRRKEGGRRGRE